MTYEIRHATPPPAAFTRRGRPGGVGEIHQFQIHATRGPTTMERQVAATENWFANGPDRGGWGSSADFVVGPDYRVGGRMAIVQFGNWWRTFGSWSAGYGSRGASVEYGAAEVGIAIELAQPDAATPFTPETIQALAWLCGTLNEQIVSRGGTAIPPKHLDTWDQRRDRPVPRGYIGHDELENGRKLGKSDPGDLFPWAQLGALLEPERLPPVLSRREAFMAVWFNGSKPVRVENRRDVYEFTRRR